MDASNSVSNPEEWTANLYSVFWFGSKVGKKAVAFVLLVVFASHRGLVLENGLRRDDCLFGRVSTTGSLIP